MNKKKTVAVLVLIIALVAASFAGCSKQESEESGSSLIADVNGQEISLDEFNKNFTIFEKNYTQLYGEQIWTQEIQGKTITQIAKEQIMEKMITEELIRQHMVEQNAELDFEGIDETYGDFEKELENSEEMKAFYEENEIGEDFIRKQLEIEEYLTIFKQQTLEKLGFDEMRLEEIYEEYVVNVRARHILVETEETLAEVEAKLNEGADFEELAKEYSIDTYSAANGGDLGYFARGAMVPEFEEASFSLPVGVVGDPVKSDYGYHLIKVEDRKTLADLKSEMSEEELEMEKEAIRNNLMEAKIVEEIDALMEAAEINRYAENIE
ncbi:MAG TPA: peptidylprolyl isomerase [Clostridia bacterium]|nr:peptidylprolyl isomerase [Clostridia bacterium]